MIAPQFEYKRRMNQVKSLIESSHLDCILITNIQNLYWLSGTAQYGVLIIHKEIEPTLFIRRNFFRALRESILATNICDLKKTSQIIDFFKKNNLILKDLKIGMELDSLPASYYNNYKALLSGATIINIELELRKLRMIKDSKELELHRIAGKISQKAQEKIVDVLRPGIKENEIAAEVICESIKNKSMHFCNINSFGKNWFIVASGENLWIPSSVPVLSGGGYSSAVPICYSDRIINKGDIVVCDYAIQYNGYHSDHARTYYVETYPDKFKERYLILKEAYLEVVDEYLKAGTPAELIYNKMKERIDKSDKNLTKFFQGDGVYYQGLGHGIGLELDEPPYILPNETIELSENMVISLEPKIIVPEWGAIDFEDNFIIKKGKPELLTKTDYLF